MKTAYIAGPVSGRNQAEVEAEFGSKAEELRGAGYEVLNPVEEVDKENYVRTVFGFVHPPQPVLNDYGTRHLTLRHCIGLLVRCDEIHLLPNWQFSEGAQIEHKIAELLKIKIVYPGDDLENLK